MSPPTINYPGEGKAWFKYNNDLLYRTFTIDKLDHVDKLMTDVVTSVKILTSENRFTILDFGPENTPEYLDREIEVEVEVAGVLLDEEYYRDPVKKTARYTREDIKDWTISLGSHIQNNVKSADYNKGKAKFILRYKIASILAQNTYTLNGNTRVNFKNNKSNENNGSANLAFKIQKVPPSNKITKGKLMTEVETTIEVLTPPEYLNILDYGEINGPEYLDSFVNVQVKVKGVLQDDTFYNDLKEREKRYNRDDIIRWDISLGGLTESVSPNTYQKNAGEAVFTLQFKRRDIFDHQSWPMNGYVKVYFNDSKDNKDNSDTTIVFTITKVPAGETPKFDDNEELPPPPPPPPPPIIVQPLCHIPNIGFDIVPFPAYDETDPGTVLLREVYINGEIVDDDLFFSGNYVFGDEKDGMKRIEVYYESVEGIISTSIHWAYIYDTKPVAQFKLDGTFKENRKLSAVENCTIGNTQIVLDHYPIISYEWKFITVDGESSSLKQRTPTSDKHREFLYKKPGVYRLELTITNTLGRVSKPYTLDFVICEDTPPAIEMNIWNGVLTRGEELKLHYSASSVDNDTVASKTLQLYYDSNNDGVCDQLVKTFPNGQFTGYAPNKLGKYKLVAIATEEFGQDTLTEFITAADKKKKTIESEFWVDNLIPMTDIYVDIPIVRPEIDLYIMMDKSLSDTKKQYITENRINFNNILRTKNILPKVETWDMKTYEYSQTVSDTYRSGESDPPSSISYSSGGYSGTLYRDRVVDNGEYIDYGGWETETEYKTFTDSDSYTITKVYRDGSLESTEGSEAPSSIYINQDGYSGYIYGTTSDPSISSSTSYDSESRYFTASHSNTVETWYHISGKSQTYESDPAPSSYNIDEDGYSGYIQRTGTSGPYDYQHYSSDEWDVYIQTWVAEYSGYLYKSVPVETVYESYTVSYSGTLSKEVDVYVPDIRWRSDYIGYYSGTIYKNVRQDYINPFRATSDKYVVYVSDGNINELTDLGMVMSKADVRLILVGSSSIRTQIAHDHYISKDKPIEEIMQEVLDYIATNSPAVEKHYVLIGVDTFDIKTMDVDEENDPIVEKKFQYVQNPSYFDNPTGMESFAAASFSENSNWVDTKVSNFNRVGEFRIFRRIKDQPSPDPNFANYSYYSGTPEIRIYAHRKPIVRAILDWDYDNTKGVYKTKWVCQSYDLDHQYSREDKGIVERKIMFRRTGGEWYYYIPEELSPGTYELQYYVKDVEGVWSDPFTMNFTLASAPSIQFDAKLRPKDSSFSLSNIPASEYLEVYDVWTRYPYDIKLEMVLKDGTISRKQTQYYNSTRDTKTGNDIHWGSINYEIPAAVKDGTYTFEIAAIDITNPSKKEVKVFTVIVNTPINLAPSMTETVMTETTVNVKATTTRYANTTRAILFYGTAYQKTLDLIGIQEGNMKNWANRYTIPTNIPEGTYTARFTATTLSGKSETKNVQFRVESLMITDITIEGGWNHWRGQADLFDPQIILTNEPHRFLSLEEVTVRVSTAGYAEKVEIRFSPELEAMQFIDAYGNIYDYKNDFGLDYISFPKVILLDSTKKEYTEEWKYILPLANDTKAWDNVRKNQPYKMTVTAWKGTTSVTEEISDIEITGSIYDLIYMQPIN